MDEWTSLALSAREGDEAARLAFVRATQSDVWRLCAHLGDREAADDLTQDTYLRVFRSLPGYRAESPVRSWLFSIVRRVVADDIASRQRRRRLQREAPAPSYAADHAEAVVLESLLDRLDDDRRTAFVLTQLLGHRYATAAEMCDCPIGTIRSRVARAREDLIAMIRADERGTGTISSESA